MSDARKGLGAFGESYAAGYLRRSGYRVLERNVRLRAGEIDIVAEERRTLVFVEVRTRRGDRFGTPEESITAAKARKLMRLGQEYVQQRGAAARDWRIDVLALTVDGAGRVSRCELVKNAVDASLLPPPKR